MLLVVPWRVRRVVLVFVLGWHISPRAYIGFSLLASRRVTLGDGARIGHFSHVRALEMLHLADDARLGSWNWIGGIPLQDATHFRHQATRLPRLVLGTGAAITSRHLLDCSDSIEIGAFSIIAGYRSQILTHSIDIVSGRQMANPVHIGERCLIGSGTIVLPGVEVADHVIVAAGAVVRGSLTHSFALYGGVPARLIKKVDSTAEFFNRLRPFVP